MLPEMPRCIAPTTFHSARLADVYSAFFILIAGLITATSIGILERIWKNRKQIRKSIIRYIRHLMTQIYFHSPNHNHQHHHDLHDQHSNILLYSYPENIPPTRDSKFHDYNAPYWNMLENHTRQVAFIGLQKLNISEESKNSSLGPRKRKPTISHKRTSWSTFVSKKKIKSAEKNVSPQEETKQALPFCN